MVKPLATTSLKYGQMFKTLSRKELCHELHKLLVQYENHVHELNANITELNHKIEDIKTQSFNEGYESGYLAGQR